MGSRRKKDGFGGRDDLEATRRYRADNSRNSQKGYGMVFDLDDVEKPVRRKRERSRSRERERSRSRERHRHRERSRSPQHSGGQKRHRS